jgi:RimJ/RimL family protein N-acetyltransferase
LWREINNPLVNRLTGTQATFTHEDIVKYVQRQQQPNESRAPFIIALPDDSRAIGEIILMNIDAINRSASVRIAIFSENDFGKGYGSEAMRLVVDYGFRILSLHRIELDVFDFNPRAIHVYEKIGFKQEGIQRDTLFYDGEYHNSILMSILEHEWRG